MRTCLLKNAYFCFSYQIPMQEFPHYYKNKVAVVNNGKRIALITFWSPISYYINNANDEIFSVGNLYTPEGFKYIILNSFLTNDIKYLLFTGNDKNDIFPLIDDFFINKNCSKLYKSIYSQLENNVDDVENVSEIIDMFIKRFEKSYCYTVDVEKVDTSQLCYSKEHVDLKFYNYKTTISITNYPSEINGFICRNSNLQHLWLSVCKLINNFGILQQSNKSIVQHDDYYEIIDAVYVLQSKNRNIDAIVETNNCPINKDFLSKYVLEITTNAIVPNISYTYGNRIFQNDNYDTNINKLIQNINSRQCCITLYRFEKDVTSPNPPCLIDIVVNIQNNHLILSAHFRSHDVFGAMRINMYALCKLQEKMVDDINMKIQDKVLLGDLIVYANSCHIYVRDFNDVLKTKEFQQILLNNTNCIEDMRGYFVLSIDDSFVVINHYNYNNELLHVYKLNAFDDNDAQNSKVIDELSFYITDIHHAMYIQKEIDKAMYCARNKVMYKQS